jgi:hypothetical protein
MRELLHCDASLPFVVQRLALHVQGVRDHRAASERRSVASSIMMIGVVPR